MNARPQPIPPGPGQESVWSYPRPPRLEPCGSQVEVIFGGVTIAVTRAPLRVLETSHPPNYYFPPDSVIPGIFRGSIKTTWCEWKGEARYYSVVHRGKSVADAEILPGRIRMTCTVDRVPAELVGRPLDEVVP